MFSVNNIGLTLLCIVLYILVSAVNNKRFKDGHNDILKVAKIGDSLVIIYDNDVYILPKDLGKRLGSRYIREYEVDSSYAFVFQSIIDTIVLYNTYEIYFLLSGLFESDYVEIDILIVDSINTIVGFCRLADYHTHLYDEGIYSYIIIDSIKNDKLYYTLYEGIGLKLIISSKDKSYIDSILGSMNIWNSSIFVDLKDQDGNINDKIELCLERRYHSTTKIVKCSSRIQCENSIGYNEYVLTSCF